MAEASGRPERRARLLPFAIVWLTAAAIGIGAQATGLLRTLELGSVDARFAVRGEQPPPRDIVVVGVDDVTFGDLRLRPPFPRSVHARMVDRLRAAGAKVIAYDFQFTEPTEPDEDGALIDAVGRAGNVVLATTEVDEQGRSGVLGGGDILREIRARDGDTVLITDPGGVVRRMVHSPQGLTSFAVVAAEMASGRRIPPSALGGRSAPIDYRGPPGAIPTLSFSRVLRGQVPAERLRGKIVVVGPTAPTFQDLHPTSTGGSEPMTGPEIQASQIDTALRGFPLRQSPAWLGFLLTALLALVPAAAGLRLAPVGTLAVAVGAAALFAVAAQAAFAAGWILPVVYPLGALLLAAAGTLVVHYAREALERQRQRAVFARFVPERVVDDVLARTGEDLRLGGVEITCTVMFSDIRGFTTFSEKRTPEEVVRILNVYLTAMTDEIMDSGGTLVAYLGDGILAVFGAPLEQEDHADRALAAARRMLDGRLDTFNEWMRAEGLGDGFRMGVGLHSGPLTSGNIGSERRLDYTVIGDTVNTASRLEGMTKGSGQMLLLSESTREMLRSEPDDLFFVDEMPVRGREGTIRVWSVGEKPQTAADEPAS